MACEMHEASRNAPTRNSSPWESCLEEEPRIWEAVIESLAGSGRGRAPRDSLVSEAAAGPIPSDALRAWAPCRLVCRRWARSVGPENLTLLAVKRPAISEVDWKRLTSLRGLNLSGYRLEDEELHLLRPLAALDDLTVNPSRSATLEGLRSLQSLSSLSRLKFEDSFGFDGALSDRIFRVLQHMSSLTSLTLSGLTPNGLEQIAQMTNLAILNIIGSGSRRTTMTNEGFSNMRHLTGLTELDVSGHRYVEDDGLLALAALTRLRKLGLGNLKLVTSAGLQALRDVACLTELDLGKCKMVGDCGLGHLSRITALEKLVLRDCVKISDKGLRLLGQQHPNLTHLELEDNSLVTDEGLLGLGSLAGLKHLSISFLGASSYKGLAVLRHFPALEHLEMYGYEVFHDGEGRQEPPPWAGTLAGCLPALTSLHTYTAAFILLTDMCPNLTTLTSLRTTTGQRHRCRVEKHIRRSFRRKLEAQTRLVELNMRLSYKWDSKVALLALPSMTQLASLSLQILWMMAGTAAAGLLTASLAPLTALTDLDLCGSSRSAVTDEVLEMLPRLPSLSYLNVRECAAITEAAVDKLLADMPALVCMHNVNGSDTEDFDLEDFEPVSEDEMDLEMMLWGIDGDGEFFE